jgi:hypothetical protein
MPFTTYAELQTTIGTWLHRSDLTAMIPDFITLGEDRIYRSLRHKDMETSLNSTISSGVLTVPSDFIQMRFAYIDSSPSQSLDFVSPNIIYKKYGQRSATGFPKLMAREGSNFIFGPAPDSDYTVKGIYYKRLNSLASEVNAIYTAHPALWLYSALCESAPFLEHDERVLLWEQAFQKILSEVSMENDGYNDSGSLVMQWS